MTDMREDFEMQARRLGLEPTKKLELFWQAARTGGDPVAIVDRYESDFCDNEDLYVYPLDGAHMLKNGDKLYTHPTPATPVAAVPDGFMSWLEAFVQVSVLSGIEDHEQAWTWPNPPGDKTFFDDYPKLTTGDLRGAYNALTAAPQPVGDGESRDLAMAIRMLVSRIGKLEGRDSEQYKKWSKFIADNGLHDLLRAQPPEVER